MMGNLLIVLAVVLIVLKVAGIIAISWIWAFSPIWLPVLVFIIFTTFVLTVAHIIQKNKDIKWLRIYLKVKSLIGTS